MQLQVIEVALGLFAAFFLLSVVASAVVALIGGVMKKRSKDLWHVVDQMINEYSDAAVPAAVTDRPGFQLIQSTSIYASMEVASRRKRGYKPGQRDDRLPAYMSARSFADATIELLANAIPAGQAGSQQIAAAIASLPQGPLRSRLEVLRSEATDDLVAIKAGLEGWFDDVMDRLEGAYKRWTRWLLFVVGLVLAGVLNVSALRIVDSLWNDPVLRTAVAAQVEELTATCAAGDETCVPPACPEDKTECTEADKIDYALNSLDGLKLPVGWGAGWSAELHWLLIMIGWLPAAAAVTMGAPFWFDLISRLTGMRGGGVPPKARNDDGSATVEVTRQGRGTAGPALADLVGVQP